MLNQSTFTAVSETVLMRLTIKQKKFIYQIARLDYRISKSLALPEVVNLKISEEEQNIKSLNAAIIAAGKGKVVEKLITWKTKAEYKLFKLMLRKNKIDIVKLIVNQSKLNQLKQALTVLEADIENFKKQLYTPSIKESKVELKEENIFNFYERAINVKENKPFNLSVKAYLNEVFKIAS